MTLKKQAETAQTIFSSVVESIGVYEAEKNKRGGMPYVGYEIEYFRCKASIRRRITLIREMLLKIEKEL